MREVILASGSPQRLKLLESIGLKPRVIRPELNEDPRPGESPEALVTRLADEKARAVASTLKTGPSLVIAADTMIVLDGEPLGKPGSQARAFDQLSRLAGRAHRVLSGLALIRLPEGEGLAECFETEVVFRSLAPDEINAYLGREDVSSVAGSYRIQTLGALLVKELRGSWSNVVGLPLELLADLASRLACPLL